MTRSPVDAPLTWNVAGLLADDPGSSRSFDVADVTIPLDEGIALSRPISGHVRFQRTNRGILADARLTTALQVECSRCLRPMEVPVDLGIEEEFLPALDLATGKPLPADAEPDVARLTDHHEIDLDRSSATNWCWPSRSRHCTARIAWGCASNAGCRSTRAPTTTRRTTSIRAWRHSAGSPPHATRTPGRDDRARFAVDSAVGAARPPHSRCSARPHGTLTQ